MDPIEAVHDTVREDGTEEKEGVGIALVFEDNGVDSLCFDVGECLGVVGGVGSVEGVDIVFAAWDGVVAVLVDRGASI